jgi:hypothetical protein
MVADKDTSVQQDIGAVLNFIKQLFQAVRSLSKIYPDRPFTPDGHLVGSIGEVVAADTYGLILEKPSKEGFDAKTKPGQTVEIKLTGGDSVVVSSDAKTPDILIVLKLNSETGFSFTEVYNGKFPVDLWRTKKTNKRGLKSLRINELKKCNPKLLQQEHTLAELNKLFA